jgi:hypothetical protein
VVRCSRTASWLGEQRERSSQQRLGVARTPHPFERATRLAFAESHPAQSAKRPFADLHPEGRIQRTVWAAVAAPEGEISADAAGDFELSAVQSTMVCGAEDEEIVLRVRASFGGSFDVVSVRSLSSSVRRL